MGKETNSTNSEIGYPPSTSPLNEGFFENSWNDDDDDDDDDAWPCVANKLFFYMMEGFENIVANYRGSAFILGRLWNKHMIYMYYYIVF